MDAEALARLLDEVERGRRSLAAEPVGVRASRDELVSAALRDLPEEGEAPDVALRALVGSVRQGLIQSVGPRYFGFVIGGATPTATVADWLTSLWDQNAQGYETSPAASVIEELVARWLLDLLGLSASAGVGFVTGAQMANFTALAVARNAVLRNVGWDVERDGLQGAPHVDVVCGEQCHATVRTAIRLMGLGDKNVRLVRADDQGRIELDPFRATLSACAGPTIVCAQAGNVNTGAFDPLAELVALTKPRGAWLHVDGAFGLWAAVSPRLRPSIAGAQDADSLATDAHKWLNVPHDSGLVIVRDAEAFRSLKTARCAYAGPVDDARRNGSQWAPENSRRARAFVLYAALRNLGRSGVQRLVENGCELAQLFAAELSKLPRTRILNDVVLNQVLCRFDPDGVADLDGFHAAIAKRVQHAGVCWLGTTRWNEVTVLRVSVSNWATTRADVLRSVESVRSALEDVLSSRRD